MKRLNHVSFRSCAKTDSTLLDSSKFSWLQVMSQLYFQLNYDISFSNENVRIVYFENFIEDPVRTCTLMFDFSFDTKSTPLFPSSESVSSCIFIHLFTFYELLIYIYLAMPNFIWEISS